MKLYKVFIQGKTSPETCEDAYAITDHYLAVIDGVSSKTDFTYQGQKTGRLAAQIIKKVLEETEVSLSLDHLLDKINQAFKTFYRQVDFPLDRAKTGLQASMVLYHLQDQALYMIGDCQARVNDQVYFNTKPSDDILSNMRSLIYAIIQEREGDFIIDGRDRGREVILPWILESTLFMNKKHPYGYSVINGEEIPMDLIKKITLCRGDRVIMTSDGYPQIGKTFEETEALLQIVLNEDPHCIHLYKSTKGIAAGGTSFDDRTYLEFEV